MKLWKKMLISIVAVAGIVGASVTAFAGNDGAKKENTIESGIYVGDIDLSGMTASEAKREVATFVSTLEDAQITLVAVGDQTVVVTGAELGVTWKNQDVVDLAVGVGKQGNAVQRYKALADLKKNNLVYPLDLGFNEESIQNVLEEQCSVYDIHAMNATMKRVDGEFQVEEGTAGKIIDIEASKGKIISYMENEWTYGNASIDLIVKVEEPRGDVASLSKLTDVLGTYTTAYKSSGSARCTNVATGCSHLDGITLYPGEQLSVLSEITPFSVANGYQMAGSYLNGQVVDSLGGGICQVSTTLYNAVLLAELQVDERSNHSMIVNYVDPSADAAIAESSGKDFKFTNNLENPIYIEGVTSPNKTITFTIYGIETRPENRTVEYQSEILETNVPPTEAIIQNGGLPIGYVSVQSVHVGYKARLWKIVKEDGVEVSREQVNSSNYKAVPRTATVGTATADPNAYNQLQAAIATGLIDHVRAVANALAAQATQAPVVPEQTGEVIPDI